MSTGLDGDTEEAYQSVLEGLKRTVRTWNNQQVDINKGKVEGSCCSVVIVNLYIFATTTLMRQI